MRSKTTLAGVLAAALAMLGEAHAAEERCNDLGDVCLCSEPLNNLDTYTVMPQTSGSISKLRYQGTSPRDLTNQTLCVRSYRNYGTRRVPEPA